MIGYGLQRVPVIDVFAGAGGLGEGFSGFVSNGQAPFDTTLSIECEPAAHKTLELRAFFNLFGKGQAPEEYYAHLEGTLSREQLFALYPDHADNAAARAWKATLGEKSPTLDEIDQRIRAAIGNSSRWILVGGPPCQAYSLAGRSRNRGKPGYSPEEDARHFLYQEYLRILNQHRPAMFVMENVKGMLSAKVGGESIFRRIIGDLQNPDRAFRQAGSGPRYRIYSLSNATSGFDLFGDFEAATPNFLVECERYGIPQKRHRVLLLGVRHDVRIDPKILQPVPDMFTAQDAIGDLPRVRADISARSPLLRNQAAPGDAWLDVLRSILRSTWLKKAKSGSAEFKRACDQVKAVVASVRPPKRGVGAEFIRTSKSLKCRIDTDWYADERLRGVCNHSARSHMATDFHRYLWAACFAEANGRSPRLADFPPALWPEHKNVVTALGHDNFSDRFKVQLRDETADTVMSHIAKDGHYYIHYDPSQCRSLTVREAARLQTFPDNFLFCGNRTEQYTQVGNAVPPLLARAIAEIIFDILVREKSSDDRSHFARAPEPKYGQNPIEEHRSGDGCSESDPQAGLEIQIA